MAGASGEPDATDPGALFDAHTRAEFRTRDLDGTMATMVDAPLVPCPVSRGIA